MQQTAAALGPICREYWEQLPKRGFVPERRSFDPMAIGRVLPVISMLQRGTHGDWRFRLVGTEIERRWRRRLTGIDYLANGIVSPRVAALMRREFEVVTTSPCGSLSGRRVEFRSGVLAIVETLRLPLRANDGSVTLILSCSGDLRHRAAPPSDEVREIIKIAEHRFIDIGAGCPAEHLLAEDLIRGAADPDG